MADPKIPLADLPYGLPGAFDRVAGVDTATGAAKQFPMPQAGEPKDYPTRASLPSASGLPDGTTAHVNNDPNPDNNGRWAVFGGQWVQSADRVTGLEGRIGENTSRVGALELNAIGGGSSGLTTSGEAFPIPDAPLMYQKVLINGVAYSVPIFEWVEPLFFEAMACGYAEDADVEACRMPQALPLTPTTGLFFFAQKNVNYYGGGENGQRLCVRDYTLDLEARTATFSETRVIEEPPLWDEGKGWVTEPFAHVLQSGPNAGRIILMNNRDDSVDQMPAGRILNIYSRYSDDGGQTWQGRAMCVPHDGTNIASAGQLIELASGRLVYPIWKVGVRGHGALLSDDHGATWSRSVFTVNDDKVWSEPSLFIADNGVLRMFVRSDTDDTELGRGVYESTDEGETWVYQGINPVGFKNSNTAALKDGGLLLMGSTANTGFYQRVKYRIRGSHDDGNTFPIEWGPFNDRQGTGYSHLAKISPDTYILGYETFSPQSASNPDGHINDKNNCLIAVFNRAGINASEPPSPPPPQTAQQYYASYRSRVIADGGEIIDAERCLSAIESAIAGGYWLGSGCAISPSWGVKMSGGSVIKIYDLIGSSDIEPNFPVPLDTTTYDWATLNFDNASVYGVTPPIQIDEGGGWALAFSGDGRHESNQNIEISVEGESETTVPLFLRHRRPPGIIAGAVGVHASTGDLLMTHNAPHLQFGDSSCAFVENEVNRFTWVLNGTTQQVQLIGAPMLRNLTRRICINGRITTGDVRTVAGRGRINEVWHLRHATRRTAHQLSVDQHGRHS